MAALHEVFAGPAALWLCGAIIGLLLPRPAPLQRLLEGGALMVSPTGSMFRRLAVLFHGAVIVRDVWQHSITVGAHAYLAAIGDWLLGRGWRVATPADASTVKTVAPVIQPRPVVNQQIESSSTSDWYVTEGDLSFFKEHMEQNVPLEGASAWEPMMNRDFGSFTYTAWRRILPNGKAEYKSVTLSLDATAEEFIDFYFDDPTRPIWDQMVTEYDVIENGSAADRCQVVRWLRHFPFAFITDREYIIARRLFRDANGCLYALTKSVEHPRAPADGSVVRMDVFYSMWRARTVPCPHGSGKPACETVLLHHEQFKIPENLARFAVKAGMGGFIKKMGPAVQNFVAERRQRVDMFAADPDAYGVRRMTRTPSEAGSLCSTGTGTTGTGTTVDGDAADERYPEIKVRAQRRRRKNRPAGIRRVASLALVAGVALAVQRTGSSRNLSRRATDDTEEAAAATEAAPALASSRKGASSSNSPKAAALRSHPVPRRNEPPSIEGWQH